MNEQDKQAYMDYLKAPKRWLSEIPSDQQTWQAALEYARGQQEPVALVPQNWTVFNSGAEVKRDLSFQEAWDYMTPERIARGWCAVCVVDGGNMPIPAQPVQHPDDLAVDKFAAAMKDKLAQAREKGRSGWEQMNPEELSSMLYEHVYKGDPRDVANFCMFLWNLGQPITKCEANPIGFITEDSIKNLQNPEWQEKRDTFERVYTVNNPPSRAKTALFLQALPQPVQPAVAQEPVHFRAVLCSEQQNRAVGVVPKVVGFVDRKAAEQFILEKRDFQGWKYNLESLYTTPPAAAINEQLLEALKNVMPWVVSQEVACNGLKCRELVCSSCFGDSNESAEKAAQAARKAYETIAAAEAAKGGV